MNENLPAVADQIEQAEYWIKARSKREREFFERKDLMEVICSFVADGGSLTTLCKRWHIRYGRVMQFINKDKERVAQWEAAQLSRKEWAIETLLGELRAIATFDISVILDRHGRVKPINEWPEGYGRMIESFQVDEKFSKDGESLIGETKKIKFHNKMRALELLGKAESLFIEKVEHRFQPITLSDLVDQSWTDDTKDVSPKE